MKTKAVVWTLMTASGAAAWILMQSHNLPEAVRLVCAWYALIVAFLLFVVVGVTLSAKFGRLDSTEGLLWRLFYFRWW
jgi:hypothetical protein